MNQMRKIEVANGRFILYNDLFFVKEYNGTISWTTDRNSAKEFNFFEAEEAVEKNNRFLSTGTT